MALEIRYRTYSVSTTVYRGQEIWDLRARYYRIQYKLGLGIGTYRLDWDFGNL